ncbi:hypothetical protein B5M42_004295 [Paenibacillus athensensis]|uniref:hypothetical protein n=1 Tax=Paenibacillus athensensis TaxID=1967502 RepID=UPI001430D047|nr:hypothetical protein [Paenibacillus athensensis]MCD1258058.1 hypothetical protein [Paenibacillus athensensis]
MLALLTTCALLAAGFPGKTVRLEQRGVVRAYLCLGAIALTLAALHAANRLTALFGLVHRCLHALLGQLGSP